MNINIDFNKKVFSQFCGDGIVESLIQSLPNINPFFVEIGAEPHENNTSFLKRDYSWSGVQIDGKYNQPIDNLYQHFVNKDNILNLLDLYNVPKNMGVFSIDIDGNDAYILHEVLKHYQPEIVIAEYNVSWGLEDRVLPYNSQHVWCADNNYGISFYSLKRLMEHHDYHFCTSDNVGVNAYFTKTKLNIENALDYVRGSVGWWKESGKPTVSIETILNT